MKMAKYDLPDQDTLVAVGIVTILHAQLDHMLRMTIKVLLSKELSLTEVLEGTEQIGSAELREIIKFNSRQKLGKSSNAFIKLQALMNRCKRATEKRNDLIHDIWVNLEGETKIQGKGGIHKAPPTVDELMELVSEIHSLLNEINHTRLKGFLKNALTEKEVTKER